LCPFLILISPFFFVGASFPPPWSHPPLPSKTLVSFLTQAFLFFFRVRCFLYSPPFLYSTFFPSLGILVPLAAPSLAGKKTCQTRLSNGSCAPSGPGFLTPPSSCRFFCHIGVMATFWFSLSLSVVPLPQTSPRSAGPPTTPRRNFPGIFPFQFLLSNRFFFRCPIPHPLKKELRVPTRKTVPLSCF